MPRFQAVGAQQTRPPLFFDEFPACLFAGLRQDEIFEATLRRRLEQEIPRPVHLQGLGAGSVAPQRPGQPVGKDVVLLGALFRNQGFHCRGQFLAVPRSAGTDQGHKKIAPRDLDPPDAFVAWSAPSRPHERSAVAASGHHPTDSLRTATTATTTPAGVPFTLEVRFRCVELASYRKMSL